jgi:large subunit ribosomal protein L23
MRRPEKTIKTIMYTEKGTRMTEEQGKYLFKVYPESKKADIKNAIEKLFGVHVTKVNTMNRKGKRKRSRAQGYGRRSDWKRAVVTLRDGETIDMV